MGMVRITIDGKEKLYEEGIKYEIIAREYQHLYKEPIALVIINGNPGLLSSSAPVSCR